MKASDVDTATKNLCTMVWPTFETISIGFGYKHKEQILTVLGHYIA